MATTYHRKNYRPSHYGINKTHLTFHLEDNHARVVSELKCYRYEHVEAVPLILHGEQMQLKSVAIDGTALSTADYQVDDETLTIDHVPAEFTLTTEVIIKPQENLSFTGLYRSGDMFCTQCESHGFRRITYYLDRPDVLSVFTTTLIADAKRYPVLLSNGDCVDKKTLSDGKHQTTWHDPHPKPSYLFALVAGNLDCVKDTFKTLSGRNISIEVYAFSTDIAKCNYALTALKDAMRWDEQRFGREYDLDVYMIVAVPDFNMGAMENKGLNLFNTKYVLANPDTATDKDFELVQAVIGHEYFHNWTGNRVTCRDWFQLSLKEGLTVFRDEEFTADMHSRDVKRIEDVKIIRSAQFAEDAGPMSHPIRPDSYQEMNNFYTATVYNKGAEVIRMIHTLLGEDAFRHGMDLYFGRHDGHAVTCDDFVTAMADANNYDLEQFRRWYAQAGTPEITVKEQYDAKTKRYILTLSQCCPDTPGQKNKKPFYMPIKLGLLSQVGEVLLDDTIVVLSETSQQYTFEDITEQPVLSILRDFSAPVKLQSSQSNEDLLTLFSYDTNAFNRWDAGQRIMIALLQQCAKTPREQWQVPQSLLSAFKNTLHNHKFDHAFITLALEVPVLATLTETYDQTPIHELAKARSWLIEQLALQLQDCWVHQYHQLKQANYTQEKTAIAERCLRNLCLQYMVTSQRPQLLSIAYQHYQDASNMTDRVAAFKAIVNYGDDELRQTVIDDFYQRYQHDALVMDKWLTIQATSIHKDTFVTVQALAEHPAFDANNPNKVYSLIRAFGGNLTALHREDGAAYRWLTDWTVKIDANNPQVAARVVRCLINWQRVAAPFGSLMRDTLEQLSKQKLSKDVEEIVSKSLIDNPTT